jgi:hypothetical protein
MLAARLATPIAVELAVRVQVVALEVALSRLASRAGGAAAGGRLDHDQRRVLFLGHLGRRQSPLLEQGVLVEQRFLQRPSHKVSLRMV